MKSFLTVNNNNNDKSIKYKLLRYFSVKKSSNNPSRQSFNMIQHDLRIDEGFQQQQKLSNNSSCPSLITSNSSSCTTTTISTQTQTNNKLGMLKHLITSLLHTFMLTYFSINRLFNASACGTRLFDIIIM